jgi:transposase
MTQERYWIGIDLGQTESHVCVVSDTGETIHEQVCETSMLAMRGALSQFPADHIGLIAVEAGPETHIVRKLRAAGYPISIFESRKASRFLAIRRNKTDHGDARGLADLARVGRHTVSQVRLKSVECQQLRCQLVMRKRITVMRVAAEGAIRARLALHGRRFKSSKAIGGIRNQVEERLAELTVEEHLDIRSDLEPLVEVCESLRVYLKKLDSELDAFAKAHRVCRLLMEVPGVGPICALSFYSAVEDPNRFQQSSDVAAYLGLIPRRHQSGGMSRTLGITKTGNKLTRVHLVTAALGFAAFAPECALKNWFLVLRDRVGPWRARVALARKLAIILLVMWKNEAHFEAYPSNGLRPTSVS